MLDNIIKNLSSQFGLGDKAGDLIAMLGQHIQGGGGVGNLVQGLQEKGLGEQAASWVSTGDNQEVSPEQAASAVGPDFINEAASKFGIDPSAVTGALSQALPGVVDKLTPGGQIEPGADIMGALQGMLGGKGGGLGDMLGGLLGGDKK